MTSSRNPGTLNSDVVFTARQISEVEKALFGSVQRTRLSGLDILQNQEGTGNGGLRGIHQSSIDRTVDLRLSLETGAPATISKTREMAATHAPCLTKNVSAAAEIRLSFIKLTPF